MFLGVSVRLCHMADMTPEERSRLAEAVRQARVERFATKLAAYQAAGVNSATWDRIENGETVKERSLRAAIRALWPSASGDWKSVPGMLKPDGPVFSSWSNAYEDPNYLSHVERWMSELQDRVELLERHVYGQTSEPRQRDATPSDNDNDDASAPSASASADHQVDLVWSVDSPDRPVVVVPEGEPAHGADAGGSGAERVSDAATSYDDVGSADGAERE